MIDAQVSYLLFVYRHLLLLSTVQTLEKAQQTAMEKGIPSDGGASRSLKPPKLRRSPWKTSSPRDVERQARDEIFRQKFRTVAELRKREMLDKEIERKFQKEMFEKKQGFEREEKEKEREF